MRKVIVVIIESIPKMSTQPSIRRPANGSERMSQRDEVDAVLVRRVLALLA
jgi:hypothetical protein